MWYLFYKYHHFNTPISGEYCPLISWSSCRLSKEGAESVWSFPTLITAVIFHSISQGCCVMRRTLLCPDVTCLQFRIWMKSLVREWNSFSLSDKPFGHQGTRHVVLSDKGQDSGFLHRLAAGGFVSLNQAGVVWCRELAYWVMHSHPRGGAAEEVFSLPVFTWHIPCTADVDTVCRHVQVPTTEENLLLWAITNLSIWFTPGVFMCNLYSSSHNHEYVTTSPLTINEIVRSARLQKLIGEIYQHLPRLEVCVFLLWNVECVSTMNKYTFNSQQRMLN